MEMRLWLNGVEISASTSYEMPPPEPLPLSVWVKARSDMPPDTMRRHPDLAEVDVYLDGFYA